MKRILFTALFSLSALPEIWAQSDHSALKVVLNDGSPLVVTLDDRRYNKHGVSLTIGDLPPGKHYVKVYAYTPYKSKQGGNAELVFSGKIKIKAGTMAYAVVDPSKQTLSLSESPLTAQNYNPPPAQPSHNTFTEGDRSAVTSSAAPAENVNRAPVPHYDLSSMDFANVKKAAGEQETDSKKLTTMQTALGEHTYSTDQVKEMMGWFSFDDTRVAFAKWCYPHVVDKANYGELSSVFSFDNTRNDFDNFMKSQK
ncbi:DUF4476 domain-containing protein [Taibaiella soli]|nr:DUF4476 domain-containing protein [Taibaiella soli]